MAKKQDMNDIISGIGDIMPPPLNGKKRNLSSKGAGGGTRRLAAISEEKISAIPLGETIEKRSFDKGLIKEIEIKTWGTKFDFYEDFFDKAVLYLDHFEPKAEYAPFFSFTPQYGHFNQKQLDYYSLWRYNVKRGKYIKKIDFSYVLLFIYEIINLTPSHIAPKDGCNMLCGIWKNYRDMFYPLDKYLSEWMCDYCIIHNLPCPHGLIDSFLTEILKKTTFPEFYLNDISPSMGEGMLFKNKSLYDYSTSKFINNDNREIFDRHISMALKMCVDEEENYCTVSKVRDSFVGALCLYHRKRRMNIRYISLTEKIGDENSATNAVKYAENMVRMGLGIKGRHQNVEVSQDMKHKMDRYFADNFLTGEKANELRMELSDEKYQPLTKGFSSNEAQYIEEQSRVVLDILEVSDEDEDVKPKDIKQEEPVPSLTEAEVDTEPEMDKISFEALTMIYQGRYGDLELFASERGMLTEAIIEEINYFAFLNNGDILLEMQDGEYKIIDEYSEVAKKWLKITN